MNKLLVLYFGLLLSSPVYAGDTPESADNAPELTEAEVQETLKANEEMFQKTHGITSEEFLEQVDKESQLNSPKKAEYEEIREIPKNIVVPPSCEDEKLQQETIKYVNDYFNLTKNEGTLYRRRRYFVMHNLDKFKEENIANYKTEATSPVSDIIASIKVNKGIDEENMRLCKNTSKDKFAGDIYLVIYPEQEGFRTQVINLVPKQRIDDEASFYYQSKEE